MTKVQYIKPGYGIEGNRMGLILDGVDLMAMNIAPKLAERAELVRTAQQFLTSLKEHTKFDEITRDQTS